MTKSYCDICGRELRGRIMSIILPNEYIGDICPDCVNKIRLSIEKLREERGNEKPMQRLRKGMHRA